MGTASSDNHALYLRDGRLFAYDLLRGERLAPRVQRYDGAEMTAEFTITSLGTQRERLPCWSWPAATYKER